MEYSRIKQATDREITIYDCLPKICKLGNGFVNITIACPQITIELEILNKKIFTIKSSTGNNASSTYTFSAYISGGYLYCFINGINKFDVGIRYTSDPIEIVNASATITAGTDLYQPNIFYVLEDVKFTQDNQVINVDEFSVEDFDVENISSTNTVIDANNKNITAGTLNIKQAYLETAQVDNFETKTLITNTLKVGKWTMASSNNGNTITITKE